MLFKLPNLQWERTDKTTGGLFSASFGGVTYVIRHNPNMTETNPFIVTYDGKVKEVASALAAMEWVQYTHLPSVARDLGLIPAVNQVSQILQWHKDTCRKPRIEDVFTARACVFEEMAEWVEATHGKDHTIAILLKERATTNYETANKLKTIGVGVDEYFANAADYLDYTDKKAHCDALCDLIVVALQDGYRNGYDMEGALNEVIRSNESKRLSDGTFPRNEAGKIIKTSPSYFEADVTPFLNG